MKCKYQSSYDVAGHEVRISSNSEAWLDCVREQITAKETAGTAEPQVCLELLEAESDEVDGHIPLPGAEYKKKEAILEWSGGTVFSAYVWERKRLHDFAGYGRLYVDYAGRRAKAVRVKGSGINPHYADIMFALGPLAGLLLDCGLYDVHASCVRVNGRGIMFTGHSGRGKSSAAFALARKGHPLLNDEKVLLIKKEGYAGLVLSDVIKISAEAIARFFPELGGEPPLFSIDDEFCFKIGRIPGLKHLSETAVDCLFIIERTGKPSSRVERVNPARVVGELFPVTMRGYESANNRNKFAFLMDFINSVDCFKVYFGTDMDQFVGAIEDAAGGRL